MNQTNEKVALIVTWIAARVDGYRVPSDIDRDWDAAAEESSGYETYLSG